MCELCVCVCEVYEVCKVMFMMCTMCMNCMCEVFEVHVKYAQHSSLGSRVAVRLLSRNATFSGLPPWMQIKPGAMTRLTSPREVVRTS